MKYDEETTAKFLQDRYFLMFDNDELKEQVKDLQQELEDAKNKLAELTAANENQQCRYEELCREYAQYREDHTVQTEQLSLQEAAIRDLGKLLEADTREMDRLADELDDSRRENEQLQSKLSMVYLIFRGEAHA